MPTLTFLPIGEKEFKETLKHHTKLTQLRSYLDAFRKLAMPYIGLSENKNILKEGDTSLTLVQLPDSIENELDKALKDCGIGFRVFAFFAVLFSNHKEESKSKNVILVLSQPAKTSWIFVGDSDYQKIVNSPSRQRQLIADFEVFLEDNQTRF